MNMKKLRNFRANPTVYYTHQSDKRFENHHENTVRTNMQFWYSVEKFTRKHPEVQKGFENSYSRTGSRIADLYIYIYIYIGHIHATPGCSYSHVCFTQSR
jgi:hypothetical protein